MRSPCKVEIERSFATQGSGVRTPAKSKKKKINTKKELGDFLRLS